MPRDKLTELNSDAWNMHTTVLQQMATRGGDFAFPYLSAPMNDMLRRAKALMPGQPLIQSMIELGAEPSASEICVLAATIRDAASEARQEPMVSGRVARLG